MLKMLNLGLHFSLRTGRESLTRLILMTLAVALSVSILLVVLAHFHGFLATADRPYWEGTQGAPVGELDEPSPTVLWNFSQDMYQGQTITRLDVAVLGEGAPVVPGLTQLPAAGEYYASPALAALLEAVSADELGNRFPGTQVGLIGDPGLSGPEELVIIIGRNPAEIANLPRTTQVSTINTAPYSTGTNTAFNFAFGLAAVALLIPMLVLISTATRLAAARREERYAALRLIGATPTQVSVIASVEAMLGALLGAILGSGIFLLLQPVVASWVITGERVFASYVTPTLGGYAAVIVGIPLASAAAALFSLRRVQVSPLGVSRRVTPPPPKVWRILPFLFGIGIILFVWTLFAKTYNVFIAGLSLAMIMIGVVIGGSWLTLQVGRLLSRVGQGATSLLASRRLTDAPQASYRPVSGLVLAVLLGTAVAVLAPTLLATLQTPENTALDTTLRVGPLEGGLTPQASNELLTTLQNTAGVAVLPLYVNPDETSGGNAPAQRARLGQGRFPGSFPDYVISTTSLAEFPILGQAANGVSAVFLNGNDTIALLTTDNPFFINRSLPLVSPESPTYTGSLTDLSLSAILIRADSPAELEQVRTLLAPYTVQWGAIHLPKTFGEVMQAWADKISEAQRVAFAVVALILIIAGCSLAITVMGSLVERKRPFTLLRLSGTPLATLAKVVLVESALPLLTAALVAAGLGLALALAVVKGLAPEGTIAILPGATYFITIGAGLLVSLIVIMLTLPMLSRMTAPSRARFE